MSRAVRGARSADLEHELPASRHVEHQPLGAPASCAERLEARRVVHAVAMLRHVRVHLHRFGLRLSRLRADRNLEREMARHLDRLGLVGDDEARRLELRAVVTGECPSRQCGGSKEPKSCSPFFHAMRSATSRGQVGEPAPRPVRVPGNVMPALGRVAVGADHETVGKLEEHAAPGGVDLVVRRVVGAEGEVAPEVAVLAQHFGARAPAARSPRAPRGCAPAATGGTGARPRRRRNARAGRA